MKKIRIIALLLLAAFVLGGYAPAHAATSQTERVTVKATGTGDDREEALENALKEAAVTALGVFSGAQIDGDNLSEDEEEFVWIASKYGREHHTVLSEAEHKGVWRITVETTIDLDELKMFAWNQSAESDLRNASTNEAGLFADIMAFGGSFRGVLNKPAEIGFLAGPMKAATKTESGAMLCGIRDGNPQCIGIDISNDVGLIALPERKMQGYSIYAKHRNGNRIFAASSETTSIYYCENEEWAGQVALAATPFEEGSTDPAGQECGGSPVAVWRAL